MPGPPLGPAQRPLIMPSYPHLLADDTAIWTRWLTTNAHRLTGVWYDVHVGTPVPIHDQLPSYLHKVADGVTRKRIDVVARAGPELWIIEVKPYGSYTALGQALMYTRLFGLEYPLGLPLVPLVICAEVDPDCVDDFITHGVRYEETGYPPTRT